LRAPARQQAADRAHEHEPAVRPRSDHRRGDGHRSAAFTPGLTGSIFGFDFNPTVDRIRLVSDAAQDLRLHPDTGAVAATDGNLAYAAGDPGAGVGPRVVAAAYTNNVAGATATQLFDIDAARDVLALQNPPNAGTLVTVGPLGVDVSDLAGFDIAGSDGATYAALQARGASVSSLYTINLGTGAASAMSAIGGRSPIRALATAGTAPADTTAPVVKILAVGTQLAPAALVGTGLPVRATCSESCTFDARLLSGGTTVATSKPVFTNLTGSAPLRLRFSSAGASRLRAQPAVSLVLVVTVTDAAGNAASVREPVRS